MRAPKQTQQRAKALRRKLTPPEAALWLRLRKRAPDLPAFRRQHPVGPYVLDFYCARAKLAVEVDGLIHGTSDHSERDAVRDAALQAWGIVVVRVPAADIRADLDETAHLIWSMAIDRMASRGTPSL